MRQARNKLTKQHKVMCSLEQFAFKRYMQSAKLKDSRKSFENNLKN